MDERQAFLLLIKMAAKRLRHEPRLRSKVSHDEALAMLTGADTIRDMSGSWHPDEMLWRTEPEACAHLRALLDQIESEEE